MKTILLISVLSMSLLIGCKGGSNKLVLPPVNSVGSDANQAQDTDGPTYESGVKTVFVNSCLPCHGTGSPLGDWTNYNQVYAKRALIKKRVFEVKDMPKGRDLDEISRKAIADWIDSGAKKERSTASNQPVPVPAAEAQEPTVSSAPPVEEKVPDVPVIAKPAKNNPTYMDDIKPLFQATCITCHNSTGPFPDWMNYEVVLNKKDAIKNRIVVKKDMPLGGTLTDEERNLIKVWIDKGLKYDKSNQPNPIVKSGVR
jgi:mono/diheme cytochrome c family protein